MWGEDELSYNQIYVSKSVYKHKAASQAIAPPQPSTPSLLPRSSPALRWFKIYAILLLDLTTFWSLRFAVESSRSPIVVSEIVRMGSRLKKAWWPLI
jgi:hypothetical protein